MDLDRYLLWRSDDGPVVQNFRRALFFPLGCGLLALAVFSVLDVATDHTGWLAMLAAMTVSGCYLWVAMRLFRGRPGWRNLALLVAGLCGALALPNAAGSTTHLLGSMALVGYCLYCAMAFRPPLVAAALAPVVLGYGVVLARQSGGFPTSLDTLILNVATTIACSAFVTSLIAAAGRSDETAAQATAAEVNARVKDARARAAATVGRVLHDDVLSALRAVAQLSVDNADLVRRACSDAIASVAEFSGQHAHRPAAGAITEERTGPVPVRDGVSDVLEVALQQMVADLRAGTTIEVRSSVEVTAPVGEVPTDVLDALRGATREAIRNARRHAGVDAVELHIHADSSGVVIGVTDHGSGAGEVTAGYGIGTSIIGRMAEVGGTATISAATPSGGTVVTLSWSPGRVDSAGVSSLAASYALTWSATGNRHVARWIVAPMIVAHCYLAARHSSTGAHPALLASMAPVLLVVVVLAVRSIETKAPTVATLTCWSVAVAGLTAVGLYLAGPGAVRGYQSWPIAFAELPIFLLAYFVPLRLLGLLVLPQLLTVVGAAWIDPTSTMLAAAGALQATVTPALSSSAIGALGRRSGRTINRHRRRLVHAEAQAHEQAALLESADRHLELTRTQIVPWLGQVVDGLVPLATDDTRAWALFLQTAARDDLYVPGFYDPALRKVVSAFRRAGGELDIRPGFTSEMETRFGRELLAALLVDLPAGHRVKLTPGSAPTAPAVRLVVLPPVPARTLDRVACLRATGALQLGGDAYATTITLAATRQSGDTRADDTHDRHVR